MTLINWHRQLRCMRLSWYSLFHQNWKRKVLELVLFKVKEEEFYCMEIVCPHSGGNLAVGDIEDWPEGKVGQCSSFVFSVFFFNFHRFSQLWYVWECTKIQNKKFEKLFENIWMVVVICPYHEYEFSLKNGSSTQGFTACTYDVIYREGSYRFQFVHLLIFVQANFSWNLEMKQVWTFKLKNEKLVRHFLMNNFQKVESRFLPKKRQNSQFLNEKKFAWFSQFADMSKSHRRKKSPKDCEKMTEKIEQLHIAPKGEWFRSQNSSSWIFTENSPKTLAEWAVLVLNTSDPIQKVNNFCFFCRFHNFLNIIAKK